MHSPTRQRPVSAREVLLGWLLIGEAGTEGMALTVRIEINLPAGVDQKTYDSIFKSIRENDIALRRRSRHSNFSTRPWLGTLS